MKVTCMASKIGMFVGAVSLAASAMVAQAGSTDHEIARTQNEQAGNTHESAGNQLDFAALKAKCLELNSNQQLKPFKAVVTCRDTKYVWRQSKEQLHKPFPNQRLIGSSIRMKGFETPSSEERVGIEDSQGACAVLEQFKITVPSVDAELSCDDLNAIDNLTEFCLEQIGNRTAEDPSLVIEEPTGKTVNTCGSSANLSNHQQG